MSTALAQLRRTPLPARAAVVACAQVAFGVFAWVIFGAGWIRVLARGLAPAMLLRDVALLTGVFLAIAVVTTWWIRHNRAIYRHKGPRRAAAVGPGYPPRDRLGRALVADVAAARRAADILVIVEDDEKTFRPC